MIKMTKGVIMIDQITKETRLESYIKTETSPRKRMILKALHRHGQLTARQIGRCLGMLDLNGVKPRLSEMLAEGKVETCGKTYDQLTDRNVAIWKAVEQ